jgi:gamma-tubulin complex component 3
LKSKNVEFLRYCGGHFENGGASYELPESELIKDIVYTFQGIDGKWIKFDPSKDAYRIESVF